jgi:hypothetical protein
VPGIHGVQNAAAANENSPALQSTQLVELKNPALVPGGHASQNELPLSVLNLPAGHGLQPIEPVVAAKVPARHKVHDVALLIELV